MNKKDRQELKASIARDLIQGQGEHTATRELLKQYAPLEGDITTPSDGTSPRQQVRGRMWRQAASRRRGRPTGPAMA